MDNTVQGILAQFPGSGSVSVSATQTTIPPEVQQMLSELPNWLKQRQEAINSVSKAYENNPNAKLNGTQAFIQGALASGTQDAKTAVANAFNAERRQNDYNLQNQVARGKAILEGLDLNTFDKMASQSMKATIGDDKLKPQGFVSNDLGAVSFDPRTQKWTVGISPMGQMKLYSKIYEQTLSELNKANGGDVSVNGDNAHRIAEEAMRRYNALSPLEQAKFVGQLESIKPGGPAPTKVTPATDGVVKPDMTPIVDLKDEHSPEVIAAMKADAEKSGYPIPESAILTPVVPATTPSTPIRINTPQDIKRLETAGVEYQKEYGATQEALKASQAMDSSINNMQAILNSGKNTSGQLHPLLSAAGGYMQYIDPTNSLAEAAGNDQLYFTNMMNLVRDKIKALGSGTAVSNLDLIVTQKSVGDLRNTPEGNKKLLAIMELQNAILQDKLGGKISYYEKNKTYDGYKPSYNVPTYIVRRSPNTGEYWIQSKQDWVNEQLKHRAFKSPEAAEKAWSSKSTQAIRNLIAGTGIKLAGDK